MSTPPSQIPQARTVAQPKRWPLVNKLQARAPGVPLTKDARLINCYAEYDPQDQEYWIYKRPGISTAAAFSSTHLLGCGIYTHPASGFVLYVTKDNDSQSGYLYYSGSSTPLATMTMPTFSGSTPASFETMTAVPPVISPQTVYVQTGVQGWAVNTSTWVATQITNADYPATLVPGCAILDGTLYVMDPAGNIWGSAIGDPTTWSGTNVIPASSNADLGVSLIKQLSYIIAFKQNTTQIFYDAGAGGGSGSNLETVPDAQLPLGCTIAQSVAQIDATILWMTTNEAGSPQIAQMDTLTPRIVSTPAVDRVLEEFVAQGGVVGAGIYTPSTGVWAFALKICGHRFYVLGLELYSPSVTGGITLVYDIDQQLWYSWTDPQGQWWPYVSACTRSATHYLQHVSNGNIYLMDDQSVYPNDAGTLVPLDIYTPNVDFGVQRRKQLNAMYFRGDRVAGSRLTCSFSDDDYTTWSTPREVDLGLNEPRLTRCGTFAWRRAYHFRHQANTTFRLKSVDLQMDLGTL